MTERYKVIEKSVSAHCCFGFTVIDLDRPEIFNGKPFVNSDGEASFHSMCECFEKEEAVEIARVLNESDANES